MIRRLQILTILTTWLVCGTNSSAQLREFHWPGGKRAAVCLTYDDGILSQLEQAIPDLNEAGMRGTFYIQGTNLRPEFLEQWRAAAAEGHELGCHSLFHPCSEEFDWVPEEYATEAYTLKRIMDEAKVMNQFLFAVDGISKRSYAYMCYEKEVGGVNYVDTLSKSGLFVGARGGRSPVPVTAENLNLFDIPSMSVTDDVPFESTIEYIEHAVEIGSLAVFCFHGIGGDYLVSSREYHQRIIDYLKANESDIWVATMAEIAAHLSVLPVEVAPYDSSF
jgi:peptidoglycan/xylan/chitin deacetylase (PgdA/CDA1 family)